MFPTYLAQPRSLPRASAGALSWFSTCSRRAGPAATGSATAPASANAICHPRSYYTATPLSRVNHRLLSNASYSYPYCTRPRTFDASTVFIPSLKNRSYTALRDFHSTPSMASTRAETDAFGEVQVDASRYWGAQTQRSLGNFDINQPQDRMPPPIIKAFGILKGAAATVNMRYGLGTIRLPGLCA
jgi:hypothetical protein